MILTLLLALSLSVLFWGELRVRALAIFVLILGVSEFFLHIRWRLSMICQHCGFDPVLYQKDAEQASQKVVAHLERKKASALGWIHPLDLPTRAPASSPDRPTSLSAGGDTPPSITGQSTGKELESP